MRSLGPWTTPTKHSRADASIRSDAEPRAMDNPNETFTRRCFDQVGCGASGHGQPQRNIHAQMLRSGRMRSLGPWTTPTKHSRADASIRSDAEPRAMGNPNETGITSLEPSEGWQRHQLHHDGLKLLGELLPCGVETHSKNGLMFAAESKIYFLKKKRTLA